MKTTIERDITEMREQAERIRTGDPIKVSGAFGVGDDIRQGDIYITPIERAVIPRNAVEVDAVRQLAPGVTQGSRHCLSHLRGVTMRRLKNPGVYDGPILDLSEPNTIEHPEHGHVEDLPAGCYAVTYQRTQDAEGRQRRVQD